MVIFYKKWKKYNELFSFDKKKGLKYSKNRKSSTLPHNFTIIIIVVSLNPPTGTNISMQSFKNIFIKYIDSMYRLRKAKHVCGFSFSHVI